MLSIPIRGDSNASWLDFGSNGETSIAAPSKCFSLSDLASASISTTDPREALIRIPFCFIWPMRLRFIRL